MNSKKIISPLLIAILFFFSFAFGVKKAHAAISISTCLELQNMELDLTADYVLAGPIDCSDTINWNGGEGFIPVGDVTPFTGTLDGQGFVISDLYIHNTTGAYAGLFSTTDAGFQVSNLGMENVSIYGESSRIGSVAGWIKGSSSVVSNCYATGNVTNGGTSYSYIGGLIGENRGDTIDSHFTGDVTMVDGGGYVAGLVAFSYGGWNGHNITFENNYFSGNINSPEQNGYVGGLIGYAYQTSVIDSHSDGGTITTGGAEYVGGLIGYQSEITTDNSYSTENIIINSGSGTYVGGLIGHVDNNVNVINSYATGNVTDNGNDYVGGLLGDSGVDVTNSYATGNVSAGDGSYVGGLIGESYAGEVTNTYSTGSVSGSGSGGYIGGLIGYAHNDSITDSHTTSGTVTAAAGTYSGGLIGFQSGVSVSNSYSEDTVISADGYAGGLVGYVDQVTTITNSYATGNVTGENDYIGGLVGAILDSDISNSYATGDVTGNGTAGWVGGLVGYNGDGEEGTISQSYATGNVIAGTNGNAGGLVGSNDIQATINNSYALGTVTNSGDNTGGLVGLNIGNISKSYSTGSLSGTINVGGLIGHTDGSNPGYGETADSFWDTENSGQATSDGGTGKTTLEMQDVDTYTNLVTPGLTNAWDFDTIWDICVSWNDGYPFLRWQTFGGSYPPCSSGNSDPSVDTLGPLNLVDGSRSNNHQPVFTFTTSDPDGGDTVKYQIIVDNDSNFSSPLVDYTSALAAPGSSSFTVGQAAGGGAYSVGSSGQSLPNGSYYWEVKTIDNNAAASAFDIANSGDMAFVIKTPSNVGGSVPPTPVPYPTPTPITPPADYPTPAYYPYPTPLTIKPSHPSAYATPATSYTTPPPIYETPSVSAYSTPETVPPPEVLPSSTSRSAREKFDSTISNVRILLNDPSVKTFGGVAITLPLLTSIALLARPIASGAPIANVLSYMFFFVPQLLRFRKSPHPWGSVYDSETKRPIPFARVEILNSDSRRLESTITDPEGRYGFLVAGEFANAGGRLVGLRAEQKNYVFPSSRIPTSNERVLYPNIYQGGIVNAGLNTTNFDLPMDPLPGIEKLHRAPYFGIVSVALNNFFSSLSNILFVLGLIFGILGYLLDPRWINLIPIGLILLTSILRISGFTLKSFGLTKDKQNNKPLAFGFLALHDVLSEERVNFTVSDALGRYFLLSPKGSYVLKAYTPAHISPMREVQVPISTRRGWVSKEIEI